MEGSAAADGATCDSRCQSGEPQLPDVGKKHVKEQCKRHLQRWLQNAQVEARHGASPPPAVERTRSAYISLPRDIHKQDVVGAKASTFGRGSNSRLTASSRQSVQHCSTVTGSDYGRGYVGEQRYCALDCWNLDQLSHRYPFSTWPSAEIALGVAN